MMKNYPLYLAGRPVQRSKRLEVRCKAHGDPIAEVSLGGEEDLSSALEAGDAASESMATLPAWRRQRALQALSEALLDRKENFARVLAREVGKPIRDARVEVSRAVETFRVAGEEAVRFGGEWMPLEYSPSSEGMQGILRRFPDGLCALITPFNFPLNLAAHKIGPALAVGNPFILKPSSSTPITSMMLGGILEGLDLPRGAFSIMPLNLEDAERLVTDPRIRHLSFTGSPAVGWHLKAVAGRAKVSLELGGNAACVVDEGCAMDDAVGRIVKGAFYQSGQSCISVQRIFGHVSLYEELRDRLVAAATELKMGDPLDEDTFIGPLITEEDAMRVKSWIDEALSAGARLLCGGRREGSWLQPTLLEAVPGSSPLSCSEAFGPVATLDSFTDFREAVRRVNDSDFGLQAGIFTNRLDHAHYAYERCAVGAVVIGDVPSSRVEAMPYGGMKASGRGREGLRFAMREMSEPRLMLFRGTGR